jgi:polysaccharide biosynthesis protein PslG
MKIIVAQRGRRVRSLLAACWLAFAALASPTHPAQPAQAAPQAQAPCLAAGPFPPLLPGVQHGVNVFMFGTDQQRVAALAQTAGFGWVRHQIHWRDVEFGPDQYDWYALDAAVATAEAADLQVMLSVVRSPAWATANGAGGMPDDPATLADFMHALAARYAGRVAAYEVWNEPNLAVENGGQAARPAHYLAVLEASYAAIKAADDCALVLAAPLAATATNDPSIAADDLAFYRELYALRDGAFLRAADVVALHPGGGDQPFDALWPADAPERSRQYFRHIEQVRALMEQAGDTRQAWITEVGWAATSAPGAPPPVSEQAQADNLVGTLRLVAERYPWIAAVFVWNLNFAVLGPPDDEKSTFGIIHPDWTPRPAYGALDAYLHAYQQAQELLLPQIDGASGYRYGWHAALSGRMRVASTRGSDGTVYAVSRYGYLYAVAPTGGRRWLFDAPDAIRTLPAHAPDGTLYIGDDGGNLFALDPHGRVVWSLATGGAIQGTPQLTADALFVANFSGEAMRVSRAGELIWRVGVSEGASAPPLLGANNTLYLPTQAGDVVALDAAGRELWRTTVGAPVGAAPTLAGDALLVADGAGGVSSLDATTGELRWRRVLLTREEAPTVAADDALLDMQPMVGGDGVVYVGGRNGGVWALDLDGNLRWQHQAAEAISAGPLLAADAATVYVGAGDRLLALDAAGQLRWQIGVQGTVLGVLPAANDELLYIATSRDLLYALQRPAAP